MSTLEEYVELRMHCVSALHLTPKWSPYRLLWKFGVWYADRKINGLQR